MSTSVKFKRRHLNWDKYILPEVRNQQTIHENQGIPATVRGLLYIFESMGVLAKKDYGSLSKHLVKWREEDVIDSDWIVDKTRRIMDIIQYSEKGRRIIVQYDENIQSYMDLITPFEHIECGVTYLLDTASDFFRYIPKWLDQPRYVEVWVEKGAMGSVVYSILNGEVQIVVAPNRGWSSYTFAKDNLERLLYQQRKGKDIYVQYYGDSDPSGERMTSPDSKMVKLLRMHGINFERIAITENTISNFGMERLKIITDPKTFRKLHNKDPNREWFKARHNGEVWQIEVDALQLDLEKFKNLVLSNANKHFDPSIHRRVLERIRAEYSNDYIREELTEQVKQLAESLGLNCY